jgi:hypothetical protein
MPAEAAALMAARDCIEANARSGCIELKYRIDVEDAQDDIIHTISFSDAVEIVPA